MNFGDISYLPYMALVYPFWLAGVDIREALAWIAIGLGLFIFVLGTITWFYGKVQKRKTIDFWIYRYSRHPQYLGFHYMELRGNANRRPTASPDGWLKSGSKSALATNSLVIICIALAEENKMRKEDSERYLQYTASAPFMFPIPKFVIL